MAAILHMSNSRRKSVKEFEACIESEKLEMMKVQRTMIETQRMHRLGLRPPSKPPDASRPTPSIPQRASPPSNGNTMNFTRNGKPILVSKKERVKGNMGNSRVGHILTLLDQTHSLEGNYKLGRITEVFSKYLSHTDWSFSTRPEPIPDGYPTRKRKPVSVHCRRL